MQQRIVLTAQNISEAARAAAGVIRNGGVVLYPTDTLYGLAVDSLSQEALERLWAIKGRDKDKPVHSVVASLEAARPYAVIHTAARKLAHAFLPGTLTLICTRTEKVPAWAALGRTTFGIRIPDQEFCLALARELGTPYTATSANKSGQTPERTVDAILQQLGDKAELIDLVIDGGELVPSLPTTVVDVSIEPPVILREGAIPKQKIEESLAAI